MFDVSSTSATFYTFHTLQVCVCSQEDVGRTNSRRTAQHIIDSVTDIARLNQLIAIRKHEGIPLYFVQHFGVYKVRHHTAHLNVVRLYILEQTVTESFECVFGRNVQT